MTGVHPHPHARTPLLRNAGIVSADCEPAPPRARLRLAGSVAADGASGAARAQLPLPWNTFLTEDFINEMTGDHVLPKGVLTLQDLGIAPRSARPETLLRRTAAPT